MEFLDIPLFDDDIYKMFVRLGFNLFFLALIVIGAIYPSQRNREFAFTAVMLNITVFFICFTLKKFELGIGMALGLFAIFGVLRYRTDAIPAKEMTYLFIVIGIAVINSLSNKKTSYVELVAVNTIIVGAGLLKERFVARGVASSEAVAARRRKPRKYTVEYDKLEWLAPAHRAQLLADLRQRTGIDIIRVQIQNVDLRNGTAILNAWYDEPDSNDDSLEMST
jgi:hypothetical protein